MKIYGWAFAVRSANAKLEVYSKLKKALTRIIPIAALSFMLSAFSTGTPAATLTVTNLNDAGAGSLRQAITDANISPGADTIVFSPTFSTPGIKFIDLQGELPITSDMTIDGSNAKLLFINGNSAGRVFNITNAVVSINALTIFGGRVTAPAAGAGILVNGGTTTLSNSTVWNCLSTGNGGGIYVASGNLVLFNTSIHGNSASLQGAGLFIDSANASATITSSTFTANNSIQAGGGVAVTNGSVTARNSIFAGNNGSPAGDFSGTLNSLGYNLIKSTTGVNITGTTTGNILGVDPLLADFSDHGGNTWTLLPANNSLVIDAGDPTQANSTDQRNARRNADGNNNGVAGVDIGAVERQNNGFDNDADDTADLLVTRNVSGSNLTWFGGRTIINSFQGGNFNPTPNGLFVQQFGLTTDQLAPGDYDGDGKIDAAVFRPSNGVWYINGSTAGFRAFQWGLAGDIPVQADYDGDGKTDIAVFRAGVWYVFNSTQGYTGAFTLGTALDRPVPADYDGDLKADPAVFNNGSWTINRSSLGPTAFQFGVAADVPVPGDYNGDGLDNPAVFRPSNGTWYISKPTGGYDAQPFGLSTDKLIPADYDGDGRTDIAVWRANTTSGRGEWYILQSRDGFTVANFGFSTDTPVANSLIH